MFHTVKGKIVAVFLVALVLAISAALVAGYYAIHEDEHAAVDAIGLSAANSCATVYGLFMQDVGELTPGTEEYDECRQAMRSLCDSYGMTYLYVCRYDTEAQAITYLMCAAADDSTDEAFVSARPYGMVVYDEISEVELSALSGEKPTQANVFDNELGLMLDWYSLVDGSNGTILGASSYSIQDQRNRVVRSMVRVVVPFVLALIVLLAVELLVLSRHVFNPLRVIAGRMRNFSVERADEVEPLGIDSRDEMSDIAEAFEGMAGNIAEYTRDIERMTAERVQSDVELDVARRIQLGMVPQRTDLLGTSFELSAFARPAREVGGDFYDAVELGGGRVALVVGDVSGKGVAAALFMAMAKTLIRDALLAGEDPARALVLANERLCASNPEGMFATVFAAVFDSGTGEVRYANAGHVPPLVVGADARPFDVEPGVLLGLFEDAEPAEGLLVLEEGEYLLVCTDGAGEAVSAEGAFLGAGGLAARLTDAAPYACARDLVDALVGAVDTFAAGCEQFDDLTVAAVRRTQVESLGRHDALPVEIDSFDRVRAEILAYFADEAAGRKACLACEEAFANIVSYSQASGIWYSVSAAEGALDVTLEDDGIPFDPFAQAPEGKQFDDLDTGGMGLGLIRSLANAASYRRENGRNILDLRFE